MARGRRRARATQDAVPSPTVDELAVRAAEAIVGRAWAKRLLRHYDRADRALDAARRQCEAAAGCLVVAQRSGDPSEISLAHAALERALDACRTGEAAREQGREALQAALDALARMEMEGEGEGEQPDSMAAARVEGGDPLPSAAPDVATGRSISRTLPAGGAPQVVRRVLGRVGLLRARGAPDPGQP